MRFNLTKQLLLVALIGCATLAAQTATLRAQGLTLSVDPYSGVITIQNPPTGASTLLDGYQITSSSGALLPNPAHTAGAGWNSLTHQGIAGWDEVSPTANALSELNLSSSSSIAAGGNLNLGNAFNTAGTKDLQWGYSSPVNIEHLPAPLIYAGGLQVQVISLLTNHGAAVQSTSAVLINQESTPSFSVDGYILGSAAGSLNTAGFHGFAANNVAGWESVAPSTTALSELNLSSSTTLAPGHDQALGSAFTAGGTRDLTLQFHTAGEGTAYLNGTVLYKSVLAGDATGDGVVNGLDINLVASNWLHTGTLPGDANYDGIVNGLDVNLIASNWLHTLAGGGSGSAIPAPEPSSFALAGIALLAVCSQARRRRHSI